MPVPVFSLFLSFAEEEYQTESKRNKTFVMIFLGPEDLEMKSEEPRGGHKEGGCAQGVGRAPPMWAPRACPDLVSSPTYSHIFPNQPGEPRKHFSTAATFCSREIPSWGLFRHPAGGGFDHGRHLHQLYCPSDEAWVVYVKPMGT